MQAAIFRRGAVIPHRRALRFGLGSVALSSALLLGACGPLTTDSATDSDSRDLSQRLVAIETPRIQRKARRYLDAEPVTVTADTSERSAGGRHDFFSEGDYWWPDPDNPDGPYIRRDGLTNPDNFIAHRQAMMRLSDIVASLTSAYRLTGDPDYAKAAITHLHAWFVNSDTRMNPNLRYGQAIHGRTDGRSIGIIDTLHLVEVARSAQVLIEHQALAGASKEAITQWFRQYLDWLTEHPFGLKERNHPNNHGAAWSLQAAAFADLVGDDALMEEIRRDFKTRFVQGMMANNGSFPAELERTKAYGYSLFMLDVMAGIAQIASTPEDDLWHYQTDDGRGMEAAVAFIRPYLYFKNGWPYGPDLLYWEDWPVRHPALVFSALAFDEVEDLSLWASLEADPDEYEVRRNFPLRHPILWLPDIGRPAGEPTTHNR